MSNPLNNSFLQNKTHRRKNILTGEWVLVSPNRTNRPWQGKTEQIAEKKTITHDPNCYLCPGNTRANGVENPDYQATYVFTNDFSALTPPDNPQHFSDNLMEAQTEEGICRVICFSPNHSLTLANMDKTDIEKVIETWQVQFEELGNKDFINHVQIFENKGAMMGCSNPHPHGQIWAQKSIPNEAIKKTKHFTEYYQHKQQSILGDYLKQEIEQAERIVYQNDDFVVLVPFWAVWPFETMIVPKTHQQNITQITAQQKTNFADAISHITHQYDQIFGVSFPYSMGISQSPTDGQNHDGWHWHLSFYPPLLRSATVKKFMVGYEMFGEAQRDISAELAAQKIREA